MYHSPSLGLSCVAITLKSQQGPPPPPRAYQLALSEETERKCDLFVLFGHDLFFVTVRTNVKSFRPPPGFIQDCPPTGAHHCGNLANMWSALDCASPNAEGGRAPPRPRFSKGGADVDAAPLREEFTLLLFI